MKKTILSIALALTALIGFTACEKEQDNTGKDVVEGLPVNSIKLNLSAPSDDVIAVTRASAEVETNVQNMALLFYKAGTDDKPIVIYVDKDGMGTPTTLPTGSSTSTSTNYQYKVNLDVTGKGITTGNWYLYAIANYDKSFCKVDMSKVTQMNQTEFLDYCVLKADREIDIVENAILMTGKYCKSGNFGDDGSLTLEYSNKEEETCTLTGVIHLRRIVAKVTFNFKTGNDNITFSPETYSIHQYSRSSTLMEREGWTSDGDAKGVTCTLGYKGSSEGEAFHSHAEGEKLAVVNNKIEFYMPENVQTAANSPEGGWAYNYREKRLDNNYNSFEYAPENSTYIIVKGQYKDASYYGEVTYTIHLGDFSIGGESNGNFTTRRNYHYTYNITVNGVNKIITEAQKTDESGKTYQHGAEGNITGYNTESFNIRLDAHYENVLLKIKIPDTGKLDGYTVMLNTPYSKNEIVEMKDIDTKDLSTLDYDWIRFALPASTTQFNVVTDGTSVSDRSLSIFDFLKEIKNAGTLSDGTYEHFRVSNGYIYTAAYVNEYYYDDKVKNAADKGAELRNFINADDRSITIAFQGIDKSSDKHSTYTGNVVFSIQQRSIKSFFNMDVDNPYGVEQVDETAATSTFGITSGGSERLNGYNNLKNAISSSTYWSRYINGNYLGYTSTQSEIPSTALTTYGKYAIYQCLSRNRDENGDGIIDDSELKWYLPAVDQCTAFWFGMNSLPESARIEMQTEKGSQNNYWNSTLAVNVWWADEGSAYGAYDSSYSGTPKVRCVRSLKNTSGTVTEVSSYNSETMVVSVTGFDKNSIRSSEISGEYSEHFRGESTDRLPQAFKIASADLTSTITSGTSTTTKSIYTVDEVKGGEWCQNYYSEEDDKSDLGKWRIPNEKELTLLFKYIGSDITDKTAARSKYNRPGTKLNMVYYVDQKTNITTHCTAVKDDENTIAENYNKLVIRCVRDATPDTSGADETDKSSNTYENGGNIIQ